MALGLEKVKVARRKSKDGMELKKGKFYTSAVLSIILLTFVAIFTIIFYEELSKSTLKGTKFSGIDKTVSRTEGEQDRKTLKYISYSDSDPLSLLCQTCAYVAPSGHMIDSKRGREIDLHDCVARSNDAPVTGYEIDVGSKTTIRTVDHRSLDSIFNRLNSGRLFDAHFRNSTFVVYESENTPFWKENIEKMDKFLEKYPGMKFFVHTKAQKLQLEKVFASQVYNLTEDIWITNAFYTLMLLKEYCQKIDVYGISDPGYCFEKENNDVHYHYYYDSTGLECQTFRQHATGNKSTHRFFREKNLFQKWREEWGNLQFYSPKWP